MKKLSEEQMCELEAGSFWDGLCTGVGIGGLFAGFLALTPIGIGVLTVGSAACLVREIVK